MSAEAAGCWEDAGCSLHQHWAFIGPVRFLKRTRGQKTPCRLDCMAGLELSAACGGVGGWPPPDAPHRICREGLWCRTSGAHSSAQPRTSVALRSGLEKPQGWAGGGEPVVGMRLWASRVAPSSVLCENSNRPDISGQFLLDPGNTTKEGTLCHAWE